MVEDEEADDLDVWIKIPVLVDSNKERILQEVLLGEDIIMQIRTS